MENIPLEGLVCMVTWSESVSLVYTFVWLVSGTLVSLARRRLDVLRLAGDDREDSWMMTILNCE